MGSQANLGKRVKSVMAFRFGGFRTTISPLPHGRCLCALLLGACSLSSFAFADSTAPTVDAAAVTPSEFVEQPVGGDSTTAPHVATPGGGPFAFLSTAPRSSNLFGDMWGLRTALSRYGITFNLTETSEVLANPTGGARQGGEYNGLATASLQMDTQRAFSLNGGLLNVSALEVHGGNLSAANLYTLQTASGVEADPAARALGNLVSAEIRRCVRRQDRAAEPRQRIHGQCEWRLFCQYDVRLADAAFRRSSRRRPRLSALGAWEFEFALISTIASPC